MESCTTMAAQQQQMQQQQAAEEMDFSSTVCGGDAASSSSSLLNDISVCSTVDGRAGSPCEMDDGGGDDDDCSFSLKENNKNENTNLNRKKRGISFSSSSTSKQQAAVMMVAGAGSNNSKRSVAQRRDPSDFVAFEMHPTTANLQQQEQQQEGPVLVRRWRRDKPWSLRRLCKINNSDENCSDAENDTNSANIQQQHPSHRHGKTTTDNKMQQRRRRSATTSTATTTAAKAARPLQYNNNRLRVRYLATASTSSVPSPFSSSRRGRECQFVFPEFSRIFELPLPAPAVPSALVAALEDVSSGLYTPLLLRVHSSLSVSTTAASTTSTTTSPSSTLDRSNSSTNTTTNTIEREEEEEETNSEDEDDERCECRECLGPWDMRDEEEDTSE